jgi:hypothetical protein
LLLQSTFGSGVSVSAATSLRNLSPLIEPMRLIETLPSGYSVPSM